MRELAIIRNVSFGVRDTSRATLWFTVKMPGCQSLIAIQGKEMIEFIENNHIENINDLEGKACFVVLDGNIITFAGLANL